MTSKQFRNCFSLAVGFSICLAMIVLYSSVATATAQDKVDFVNDIKPIFERHCISCHGPEKEESFRMDDSEDALAYVEPGDAEDSDLYLVLVSDDEEEIMPPAEDDDGNPLTPLSETQITLVKTWINQGADWPEGVELVDTQVAAPGLADSDDGDEMDPEAAAAKAKTQQIFNSIGSLHPAAIHLPIGLLLGAGLFAFFSLRGNFVMSDCAYYCLWLGTLGAIIACATGWWFSPMENRGTVVEFSDLFNQDHKVFWHRTGGLAVTAFAFLLALFAAGARNRDPDEGVLWKLGAIALAVGIGWVGHTGGELHYGESHYEDLNNLYEESVVPLFSGGAKAEKADEGDSDDGIEAIEEGETQSEDSGEAIGELSL